MCPECGSKDFYTVGRILEPDKEKCAGCGKWVVPIASGAGRSNPS